jgi:hypothetical protein
VLDVSVHHGTKMSRPARTGIGAHADFGRQPRTKLAGSARLRVCREPICTADDYCR